MLMEHDLSGLKAKFERDAAQYVFVQKKYEALVSSDHPVAMYPKFRDHYVLIERGKDLAVYKRKAN
jgi:phage anti-repressor protein